MVSFEVRIGGESRKESHLNTVNGRLLLVHDDGVDIPTKNNRHGDLVFPLDRFAEIDNAATNTCKDPLFSIGAKG